MGRVIAVLAGVAVLALQIWITLYAQVVLAYEAALVLVLLLGIGLRAFARSRRRTQRIDGARWPGADGVPVPQTTVLYGGPVLPSVDFGTGSAPVAAQIDDRAGSGDALRRPRPLV
jgi:hypothetical protein